MGTETTSAAYRRTQTHESQSFSAELLEAKGTGNEQSSQNHHFKLSFVSNNKVYKKQLLITIHMCVKLSLVLPYSVGGSPSSQEY